MKNNIAYFTAGEFAKLHHLNKRTLHYYDEIGLFSPRHKGDNGYRYYTYEQSIELENILALRELNMSINEIKDYTKKPNSADFIKIANLKIEEIDTTIKKLKKLKNVLYKRKEMLSLSNEIYDCKIELVELNEEYLLTTPLNLNFDHIEQNALPIMEHLKEAWDLCSYKKSCGSFISLEKVRKNQLDEYDGIFTVIDIKGTNLFLKPKGTYIRGFLIGDWNRLPLLYNKLFKFAEDNNLTLTGYAFERGINEFAISDVDEYVTQVEIHCK
ncbi:MerR family transcriptional regulator [uncultured Clostridium sp.]|uniref:MerR family transcriptional regulator n=1 Tax=uncultured Clostridium sp. TaxID=59620 RepID=UPI002613CA58|nr:MerR family transcriptional regulator [uncultured Clostridium sp.]